MKYYLVSEDDLERLQDSAVNFGAMRTSENSIDLSIVRELCRKIEVPEGDFCYEDGKVLTSSLVGKRFLWGLWVPND